MDCVQALHHLGEIVERLELQKAVRETQKKKIQVRIEKNQKGPASKKKKSVQRAMYTLQRACVSSSFTLEAIQNKKAVKTREEQKKKIGRAHV